MAMVVPRTIGVRSINEAVKLIESGTAETIAPRAFTSPPDVRVTSYRQYPDRIEIGLGTGRGGSDERRAGARDQPTATSGQPAATSEQRPATSEQRPATSEQRPATSDQRSASSDQRTATSGQRPATREQRPATLLFVNQSYFTAWDSGGLPIVPLDIDRLGVLVPDGVQTVTLRFGRHRMLVVGAWVISSALLLAVMFALRIEKRDGGSGQVERPADEHGLI